jgi:hypothetical protein
VAISHGRLGFSRPTGWSVPRAITFSSSPVEHSSSTRLHVEQDGEGECCVLLSSHCSTTDDNVQMVEDMIKQSQRMHKQSRSSLPVPPPVRQSRSSEVSGRVPIPRSFFLGLFRTRCVRTLYLTAIANGGGNFHLPDIWLLVWHGIIVCYKR